MSEILDNDQVKNETDTTAITVKGRAIEEEEIEVPAGKFNTIKIEIVVADREDHKTTFTQWLAKGIGSVKMNVNIEGNQTLRIISCKIYNSYYETYFSSFCGVLQSISVPLS